MKNGERRVFSHNQWVVSDKYFFRLGGGASNIHTNTEAQWDTSLSVRGLWIDGERDFRTYQD